MAATSPPTAVCCCCVMLLVERTRAERLCDVSGARCPAPPLGLITLAALLPSSTPPDRLFREARRS